jgi:hypothetical protein
MTKQEAAVIEAARMYSQYGRSRPTVEAMRLFQYWEARLLAAAMKLKVEQPRKRRKATAKTTPRRP